ncbi:unnamed protein product [Candidula unifasciata]|uniref:Ion transport domain-containing protein n=1 Tax=Candidula unifasciata TaxID=100452 RepID=A0A8S3YX69_9EUPU|nr:unnamed protein product [Candidula unifasciata]
MGNLPCVGEKDEAWKQQNKEMEANPAYQFVNLTKGGSLIEAYNKEGPQQVVQIARNEMAAFLYDVDGKTHRITESEFLRWKWKCSQKASGSDKTETISDQKLKAAHVEDYFHKFTPHDACWDLDKRGGVGETPFHLLFLMDSPVHFEVAKILLMLYPNLALDVYEGEEYYGESALHIAIVVGDFELVQLLVEAGADVNQRATGRFFLPEDQKKGYTGHTNYEGYAYYGEYPLAFAACLGRTEIYDYLLEHGAHPDLQDVFGNTVLHMVVISNQSKQMQQRRSRGRICEMYRYALHHHKIRASTCVKNNDKLAPLALACKLGRYSIFKEMMDLDSIEFWRFSTTLCSAHPLHTLDTIAPDGSTNKNSALMIIVNGDKEDHLEMLEGGVMRQLLIEKWKTFAKKQFMLRLVFAVTHIVMFSICVYTRPMGSRLLEYRGSVDAVRYTCEIMVTLNCLVKVLYEVTEIFRQGIHTFINICSHAPAQTVYLISCLLLLACLPLRLSRLHAVEDILVILAAPCVWSSLLFFARGYSLTGPFVTMIYKMIVGDLFRFGIIYVIFLAAFTQVFFFLFHDVKVEENTDLDKFSTFPEAILKIYQMSFGEFKYDVFNLSHYAPLTKIIFGLFLILVPILLLNMLIAMMGNTHLKIISKSTKEWWKQWAKIVVVLESGISKKKLLQYQKAYSVTLAASSEQRALVVISLCSKSKAKKRKEAVFRWKALSREIIYQLHHSNLQRQQFVLKESLRKGRLLDEENHTMLTSTVTELAWVKDIDLTKGHSFVTDKDSVHSYSPCDLSPSFLRSPAHAVNGSPIKTYIATHLEDSNPHEVTGKAPSTPKKRRRRIVHNKVYPLITTEKEVVMNASDTLQSFVLDDSESDVWDRISFDDQLSEEEKMQITNKDSSQPQGSVADDRV